MTNVHRLAAGLIVAALASCAHSNQSKTNEASSGAALYAAKCESCHGARGEGTPGLFPPVAANPVVTGDAQKLIHIVKYGLNGKLTAGGRAYDGMMPAWSPLLSDADIASVLTYVRASWGNSASPITAEQVGAVNK